MRTESAALARVHERQQVHLSTKEFCLQSSPIGFGSKWFPKREHLDRLISQCDYQFRLYLLELRPQLVRSGVRQCGEGAAPRRKMSGGKPQLIVSCMHAFQGIESAGGVLLGSAGGLWPPTDGFICVLSKSGCQFHPILHLRGSIMFSGELRGSGHLNSDIDSSVPQVGHREQQGRLGEFPCLQVQGARRFQLCPGLIGAAFLMKIESDKGVTVGHPMEFTKV